MFFFLGLQGGGKESAERDNLGLEKLGCLQFGKIQKKDLHGNSHRDRGIFSSPYQHHAHPELSVSPGLKAILLRRTIPHIKSAQWE
jgi:hypothetical protein